MSHGGRESGKVHERVQQEKRKCSGSGDEFSKAIANITVAQICENVGFQTFQQSALEVLSHVAVQYIRSIGKTAQFYANMAGRTESNAFDVLHGLEDLGSGQGFSGASDVDHCLASSGVVREIVQYVGEAESIPFAYLIPPFPVVKERKPTPSFLQIGEEPPEDHIPAWLPKFPGPETYGQLPAGTDGAAEDKAVLPKQNKETDRPSPSLNLQPQLACNGSERHSSFTSVDGTREKGMAESNPYLATPLQFGEREVSYVVPPSQLSNEVVRNSVEQNNVVDNHVSVLETFAPAIEAMKNKLSDSEDGQKKVLLNQRPFVKFKIGTTKKPLDSGQDLSPQEGVANIGLWFSKEDKCDKKRRAEEILKQSMENPGELPQL